MEQDGRDPVSIAARKRLATTKRPGGQRGTSVPNFPSGPSGGASASSGALPQASHPQKDISSGSDFRGVVDIANVPGQACETHRYFAEADRVPELPFSEPPERDAEQNASTRHKAA